MKIYLNQLEQHLQKTLPKVVMLFGDEPFQLQQALDSIRKTAKQQGLEERVRYTHDQQFKWQQLNDEGQALSLFASRKLIELEIPSAKPGRDGSQFLQSWAADAPSEHVLLLWGGKLGREQTNAKWFKTLDKIAWFIPIYDIESSKLPQWLQQQFKKQKLSASPDAIALMCQLFEGNLLSAAQEVTRLALLHPNQHIDIQQVKDAVSDQSRFTVFQLVDDLLSGHFDKALHVLKRLQGEDLEPVIVSWALQKELDTLQNILQQQSEGLMLPAIFKNLRIWDKKQGLYRSALNRLNKTTLYEIADALALFDLEYKTHGLGKPYTLLSHCCLLFSGDTNLKSFNKMLNATSLELRAEL